MKKRHVLVITFLAVCFSHLTAYVISSCSEKSLVSEFKHPSYSIASRKEGAWRKSHLTWSRTTPPSIPKRLSERELVRAIEKSFKEWEQARVFTFSHTTEKLADITISFQKPPDRRWDGRMGLMGAAFFPWQAGRGHIYLDPAEWWSTEPFSLLGDPIEAWLPHEIGHVLGLPHVLETADVMYERGPYGPPEEDDFSQLRNLYAPKILVPTWAKNTTISAEFPGGE